MGDAFVEVSGGGETLELAEQATAAACLSAPEETPGVFEGSGCYTGRFAQPIAAGSRYELRVQTPGGRVVTGAAHIPRAPLRHSPEQNARLPASTRGILELLWEPSADVARMEVTAFALTQECGIGIGIGDTRPAVNFVAIRDVLAGRAAIPLHLCGLSIRAYARYFDEVLTASSVRFDRASAGVRGALGFFVGTATIDRDVTVLRD